MPRIEAIIFADEVAKFVRKINRKLILGLMRRIIRDLLQKSVAMNEA